jgi:SLOG cluster2/ATPase family associated with various cellular activities (AAA)
VSNGKHAVAERAQARRIAGHGLSPKDKTANVRWLGDLPSFTEEEYQELKTFHALVDGYLQLKAPPRPLCLAVFGPPGSGKSYVVRAICNMLEDGHPGTKLPLEEVNLTELGSATDLIRVIRRVRLSAGENSVPVIFFDEFDAPLAGVPLGWLSRFLAPMQDGTLVEGGEKFEFKRAVYIFAGGTAARMADFGAAPGAHFREAKGPDFVSRLRGYIDVRGPNDPIRTALRRAVLIRSALTDVEKARTGGKNAVPRGISFDLLNAMLDVGRYRHGSRSIKAIIEMAAAASKDETLDLELSDLPPDHVLSVHRDLGPLDPLVVGGLVGLSAGEQRSGSKTRRRRGAVTTAWKAVTVELACELWKLGAVIGFGGKWDKGRLAAELLEQLKTRARFLVEATPKLTSTPNPPAEIRVEVFTREGPRTSVPVHSADSGMMALPVPAHWSPEDHNAELRQAATPFRMRWMMSCRCVARVLISGKISGFSGRMPGILEETMLALCLRQPLYIIGGFGGAAQVVGELLGLASTWPSGRRSVGCFSASARAGVDVDRAVAAAPHIFRPAGFPNLPLTFADAMVFVPGYSLDGPGWPPNGLTVGENRELFATRSQARIVELVLQGLTRRFRA